jgi:virulence-associated protein VagC
MWIKPVPGEALTFRPAGQELTLKPLNQSWQRFAVYWTVS